MKVRILQKHNGIPEGSVIHVDKELKTIYKGTWSSMAGTYNVSVKKKYSEVVKKVGHGVRTKRITMRQSSGLQYSLTASVVDTPNGNVRTLQVVDHAVMMIDKKPSDTFTMSFNENALDTNVAQLRVLCEFILDELNMTDTKKRFKKLL